ncbi:hypothetical protein RAH34_04320 [Chryseobacterium sp. WLY505]|nr:hypothetical protein [Chryseobacterium sp. WLY505]
MEYAVGTYKIVPPKPFPSFEKAVEYIQEKYPELDVKTIEKHLTPKISNNGKDQPGDIREENSVGNQSDTETGTAGAKRVKPSINKPG